MAEMNLKISVDPELLEVSQAKVKHIAELCAELNELEFCTLLRGLVASLKPELPDGLLKIEQVTDGDEHKPDGPGRDCSGDQSDCR